MLHNKRLGASFDITCTGSAVTGTHVIGSCVKHLRVCASGGNVRITISPAGSTAATATSTLIPASFPEVFAVYPGDQVSAEGANTVAVNCTELL